MMIARQPGGGGRIGRHARTASQHRRDRHDRQHDRQQRAVRARQPAQQSPEHRATELVLMEVVDRAHQREQEQAFRVGGAEEHRERIRREQHHRGHRLVFVLQQAAREAQEIGQRHEERHQRDRHAGPERLAPEHHGQVAHRHRKRREERDVLLIVGARVRIEPVSLGRDAEIPAGVPPRRQVEQVVRVDPPAAGGLGRKANQQHREERDRQHAEARCEVNRQDGAGVGRAPPREQSGWPGVAEAVAGEPARGAGRSPARSTAPDATSRSPTAGSRIPRRETRRQGRRRWRPGPSRRR